MCIIRLGFHLSIAGGVSNSAVEARAKGYGTFQLFVSNPRSWKSSRIGAEESEKFIGQSKGIPAFAHMSYLCNPSSPDSTIHEKSLEALHANMENCNSIGVKCMVVHLGSHLGRGTAYGLERATQSISEAIDSVPDVTLLLENSAGYKNSVGSRFEEISSIMRSIGKPSRVGLCFDTCHAFAAGYDLHDSKIVSKIADEITNHMGKNSLGLVHLNDAKFELGSGLDRHWHIGKGNIGTDGFKMLFSNPLFRSGSFVMETPLEGLNDACAENMMAVKEILKSCGID